MVGSYSILEWESYPRIMLMFEEEFCFHSHTTEMLFLSGSHTISHQYDSFKLTQHKMTRHLIPSGIQVKKRTTTVHSAV